MRSIYTCMVQNDDNDNLQSGRIYYTYNKTTWGAYTTYYKPLFRGNDDDEQLQSNICDLGTKGWPIILSFSK